MIRFYENNVFSNCSMSISSTKIMFFLYYSYLPACIGMHVVKVVGEHMCKDVEGVLVNLGEYFQIQGHYLDCYGNSDIMRKIGRDIEDKKCSWLVVQILKLHQSNANFLMKTTVKMNKRKFKL